MVITVPREEIIEMLERSAREVGLGLRDFYELGRTVVEASQEQELRIVPWPSKSSDRFSQSDFNQITLLCVSAHI